MALTIGQILYILLFLKIALNKFKEVGQPLKASWPKKLIICLSFEFFQKGHGSFCFWSLICYWLPDFFGSDRHKKKNKKKTSTIGHWCKKHQNGQARHQPASKRRCSTNFNPQNTSDSYGSPDIVDLNKTHCNRHWYVSCQDQGIPKKQHENW